MVSLIKHSRKDIDIDHPDKDAYCLRDPGCWDVLLLGQGCWTLMYALCIEPEPFLNDFLAYVQHCDVVLIEGFKDANSSKLDVWRTS